MVSTFSLIFDGDISLCFMTSFTIPSNSNKNIRVESYPEYLIVVISTISAAAAAVDIVKMWNLIKDHLGNGHCPICSLISKRFGEAAFLLMA